MRVAMSAIRHCRPWKSAIGWPNASRSLAYRTDSSKRALGDARAPGRRCRCGRRPAWPSRSGSPRRPCPARRPPARGSPRRRSASCSTPECRASSLSRRRAAQACRPGSRNAVMPRDFGPRPCCVSAYTRYSPASPPLVIQLLGAVEHEAVAVAPRLRCSCSRRPSRRSARSGSTRRRTSPRASAGR